MSIQQLNNNGRMTMETSFESVELMPDEVVAAVRQLADDYDEARESYNGALARIAEVRGQTQRLMVCLHMADLADLPVEDRLALAVAEVMRRLPPDAHLPTALRDASDVPGRVASLMQSRGDPPVASPDSQA